MPCKGQRYQNCVVHVSIPHSALTLHLPLDVHLTNVAVQKTAPDYDPEKGCKWPTQQLRMYLCAKHGTDAVSLAVLLIWVTCTMSAWRSAGEVMCFNSCGQIQLGSLEDPGMKWFGLVVKYWDGRLAGGLGFEFASDHLSAQKVVV